MTVHVTLQEPLSFSLWPLLFMLALLIACGWALVRQRKAPAEKQAPMTRQQTDYLLLLRAVDLDDSRRAHQRISEIIRAFAAEKTGLAADAMTLYELRAHHLDRLAEVITLCYEPEFAAFSGRDAYPTLKKAEEVIATWH